MIFWLYRCSRNWIVHQLGNPCILRQWNGTSCIEISSADTDCEWWTQLVRLRLVLF